MHNLARIDALQTAVGHMVYDIGIDALWLLLARYGGTITESERVVINEEYQLYMNRIGSND